MKRRRKGSQSDTYEHKVYIKAFATFRADGSEPSPCVRLRDSHLFSARESVEDKIRIFFVIDFKESFSEFMTCHNSKFKFNIIDMISYEIVIEIES